MSTTQISPAKLNLFLNIIDRNRHGYHILQSFFAKLDLHDTLTLSESKFISCQMHNAVIQEENLIYKAAKLMQTQFLVKTGAHFTLHKNIPIGSGMGGGSSNAATAIMMLNNHWQLGLTNHDMAEIGLRIGADVPFFIYQKHALVEGVGEIIQPINLNQTLFLLLVYPGFACNTAQVFNARQGAFSKELSSRSTDYIANEIYIGKNDLQAAAINLHPMLQGILSLISSQYGCKLSRLSGSGSTCFGLFDDAGSLNAAKENIKKISPQFWLHSQELNLGASN